MVKPRTRQPVTGNNGIPRFAGSEVPVQALIDHLDAGRDLETFLGMHPDLRSDIVAAALARGLELLASPGRPRQASFLPQTDGEGTITNTEELPADLVIGRAALCPACKGLAFKAWPEGWDAHAAYRCAGLQDTDPDERKEEFKRRYGYLFR